MYIDVYIIMYTRRANYITTRKGANMASAMYRAANNTRERLDWADDSVRRSQMHAQLVVQDRMPVMGEIRLIGGALVLLLLITFVLTEIFNAVDFETDGEGDYTGPFGSIAEDLETIGPVALSLLVLALLVVAAAAIMRFFGQSGFGAR